MQQNCFLLTIYVTKTSNMSPCSKPALYFGSGGGSDDGGSHFRSKELVATETCKRYSEDLQDFAFRRRKAMDLEGEYAEK
jgi:hypothetical protein